MGTSLRPEKPVSGLLRCQRRGGHPPGLRRKGRESPVHRRGGGGSVKKATLERVQARLSEYVAASVKHPVLILRAGKPVAMLIGLDRKVHRTPTKLRVVLKRAW